MRTLAYFTFIFGLASGCDLESRSKDKCDGPSDCVDGYVCQDRVCVPMNTADGGAGDAGGSNTRIGTRCTSAGSCLVDEVCKSDFFFERKVCTKPCDEQNPCPNGTECVNAIPDYNGSTVGPFCLRPCTTNTECEVYGSECDTYEGLTRRYCF